jgi:hypothetical protein
MLLASVVGILLGLLVFFTGLRVFALAPIVVLFTLLAPIADSALPPIAAAIGVQVGYLVGVVLASLRSRTR